MTRKGKIARLPRHIRDELNQRLDDGEPGIRLVEWLNSLPEVQEILKTDFGGRPINEVNLTEWKQGGFLDWQAQRETNTFVENLLDHRNELPERADSFTENVEVVLLARYAAAVYRSSADPTEDSRERAGRLGKSVREVVRLSRCGLSRERVQIERQRLELERSKMENHKNAADPASRRPVHRSLGEGGSVAKTDESLSHQQKAEIVKQMLATERQSLLEKDAQSATKAENQPPP